MSIIGILSDIHAHHSALVHWLDRLHRERATTIIVCGDVVGYGNEPDACCDELRRVDALVAAGNHDRAAVEQALEKLSDANRAWLDSLPMENQVDDLLFTHAVPQPNDMNAAPWPYVFDGTPGNDDPNFVDIRDVFQAMKSREARLCFAGHSHIPAIFQRSAATNDITVLTPCPESDIRPGLTDGSEFGLATTTAFIDAGSASLLRRHHGESTGSHRSGCALLLDDATGTLRYIWETFPTDHAI